MIISYLSNNVFVLQYHFENTEKYAWLKKGVLYFGRGKEVKEPWQE